MKMKLTTIVIFLTFIPILVASVAAAPPLVMSAGNLFVDDFEKDNLNNYTLKVGNGNVKDGMLCLEQMNGDNFVDTPEYKTDANEDYTVQCDFLVPADAEFGGGRYLLMGMLNAAKNGYVADMFVADPITKNTFAMPHELGEKYEMEVMYTTIIHVHADHKVDYFMVKEDKIAGWAEGKTEDNSSVLVRIGNIWGASMGALMIDNVKVGKTIPYKGSAVEFGRSKLPLIWGILKTQ